MAVSSETLAIIESANVVRSYPDTIDEMTDAELQESIEAHILTNEVLYKALADQQDSIHGPSVMVLMPGESVPRFLSESELSSVTGEHSAAATALSALSSVSAGQTVVIAQGWSFQMKAFVYEWAA